MEYYGVFKEKVFLLSNRLKIVLERLSVETSHPYWLVDRWIKLFGYDETLKMCQLNLTAPIMTARVNLTRTTVEQCLELLEDEGFTVKEAPSFRSNLLFKGEFSPFKSFRRLHNDSR